jgi:hypothetical protein
MGKTSLFQQYENVPSVPEFPALAAKRKAELNEKLKQIGKPPIP